MTITAHCCFTDDTKECVSAFDDPRKPDSYRMLNGGPHPLVCLDRLSQLQVVTGGRRNFYKDRPDAQHAYLFDRYVTREEYYSELVEIVERNQAERELNRGYKSRLLRLYERRFGKLLSSIGVHPKALVRFRGRGGLVRQVSRRLGKDD